MFGVLDGTGVSVLDPRFHRVVPGSARVERLWTGARWSEGPAWFPAHNTLVWSDIPNDRMLRYDALTGQVGVFRQPARNSNGNTVDAQGRLVTCEHGGRQVTRTEHDGSVTTIGSDHVARKRETKDKDIWGASAGFPGSGLLLPLLLHEGYHRRGLPLDRIVELTSANAAKIYNMPSKGGIAVGKDADLLVVDPDLERTVDHAVSESFSDYSPYQGMALKGWPVRTLVRGRTVMLDGRITDEARAAPWGRYLDRHA